MRYHISEQQFKVKLGQFLTLQDHDESCANGALYLNNLKIDEDIKDIEKGNFHIKVSDQLYVII